MYSVRGKMIKIVPKTVLDVSLNIHVQLSIAKLESLVSPVTESLIGETNPYKSMFTVERNHT